MKEEKKKNKKRITPQCIGIVLICFALGLFAGHACNYQDAVANILPNQSKVHVIHSSSEMAERGAKIVLYTLGSEENDNYKIDFNSTPVQEPSQMYNINGIFTNTSENHFTTIELNFSLLDKEGNKIGDAYAFCDGLDKGQTWVFNASNNKVFNAKSNVVSAILDDVILTTL